jgi:ABC-type antimicrobial peptide transport system permease subunit
MPQSVRSRSINHFLGAFFGYFVGVVALARCLEIIADGGGRYGGAGVVASALVMLALVALLIGQSVSLFQRKVRAEVLGSVIALLISIPVVLVTMAPNNSFKPKPLRGSA